MNKLTILGKEYPFLISAAAAKKFFNTQEADDKDELGIDSGIRMIHQGLMDGSLSKSWVSRNITDRVPSIEKLERMVSPAEIRQAIKGLFVDMGNKEGEEEGDEKKISTS